MSAPTHTALSVQQFLTKNGMTPVPHSPCLPSLVPSNLFLFYQMKEILKGKHFASVEKVKQKMAGALKVIKINKCSGKKISIGILHQMESTLKVTEV